MFHEPTRLQMKRACRAEGIATPAYVLARKEADVERAAESHPDVEGVPARNIALMNEMGIERLKSLTGRD